MWIKQLGKLAKGDFSIRVSESGSDEMAALSRAFNQMAVDLQQARQKQEELEGMRRDLIAWVSHDLRTPLTSIRAILEALGDGVVEDPEDVRRYISNAQAEIRSLSNLIDDLFVMAQMDAGGLTLDSQENSLGDLISDTLESFSELVRRKSITLTGSIEPGVDPVRFDNLRLSRAVNNLVSNALRHTPVNGTINVCAWRSSKSIEITVADSAKEFLQKISLIFLIVFTGLTNHAAAKPAVPGLAWRLPEVSLKRTQGKSQ